MRLILGLDWTSILSTSFIDGMLLFLSTCILLCCWEVLFYYYKIILLLYYWLLSTISVLKHGWNVLFKTLICVGDIFPNTIWKWIIALHDIRQNTLFGVFDVLYASFYVFYFSEGTNSLHVFLDAENHTHGGVSLVFYPFTGFGACSKTCPVATPNLSYLWIYEGYVSNRET